LQLVSGYRVSWLRRSLDRTEAPRSACARAATS
jgi:hypothetical protein